MATNEELLTKVNESITELQKAQKTVVDAAAEIKAQAVTKDTDETLKGTKTFMSIPLIPTAAANDRTEKAASTKFVMDAIDTAVEGLDLESIGGGSSAGDSGGSSTPTEGSSTVTNKTLITVIGSAYSYVRTRLPQANKNKITVFAGTSVLIGTTQYVSTEDKELNADEVATGLNRAGKDMYIFAVEKFAGNGTKVIDFILSMSSTVPAGYTADNSRKIGGFHCECLSVGNIAGHLLNGLETGDIIPNSVWDLWHFPKSKRPEGFAYCDKIDLWVGIYGLSWGGSFLETKYQGEWMDGTSNPIFHGEKFVEELAKLNMRLPTRAEFQIFADGSNQCTAIQGANDHVTTGGHVDTAGRRMISDYGMEDCCGDHVQWSQDYCIPGGSSWTDSVYAASADAKRKGQTYGTCYRVLLGGYWGSSSYCGSRYASGNCASAYLYASFGARAVSEPGRFNP